MQISPLCDEVRVALVLILLKPGLDIGRHGLSVLGAALIRDNRAKRARDPITHAVA
jgi:hypothetical protein